MDQEPATSSQQSIAQLEKQLHIKQLQVSSLLEVTQAINNNLPVNKLFRIYEFVLRAQIQVSRLLVFTFHDDFQVICRYGTDNIDEKQILEAVKGFRKVTYLNGDNPLLNGFDIVIPVYHKEQPLAFALLEMPEDDPYEKLDEKIKFIQTITNIIAVAVENKKLFKKQLEQEKMKREMELAGQVQSMLIPAKLPDNEHIQMSAVYLPHANIGGDYYDF